ARRRGGRGVAARGARTAIGDAGDWLSRFEFACGERTTGSTIPPGLAEAGYVEGRNVAIEYRWAEGQYDRLPEMAAELVRRPVAVIAPGPIPAAVAAKAATTTIPLVFYVAGDPVKLGLVVGLARPGGNATGFMAYEYGFAAKWLELLKEIAPSVTRVGVIRYAANPAGIAAFSAIQNAAQSLGLLVSPINVRDPREIERSVGAFASSPNGGLVVTQTASATVYRDVIIAVSARQKLPAVYGNRYDATAGGLISYAPDIVDQFRQTAGYVDRILKGAKPDEMPVQAPTKYELLVNLKTARALGLSVPPTLLARADEVIE